MNLDPLIAAVIDFKRASTPIRADESFQRIVESFGSHIERHVRSQPLLDPEDARQECLVCLWKAVEEFDPDAYYPAAIVKLANMKMRSRLMDLVEAQNAKRRSGRPLSLDYHAEVKIDPEEPRDHFAAVDSADLVERYRAALASFVTPNQFAVIFESVGGETQADIARRKGCRVQRVFETFRAVREKIRLVTENVADRVLDAPAAMLATPPQSRPSDDRRLPRRPAGSLPLIRRQPPKMLAPVVSDRPKQRNRRSPKADRARQLILDMLADGERSSTEIVSAAAERGISGNVVREVARSLPIEAREIGYGKEHRRLWRLVDISESTTGETNGQ